MFKCWSWFSLHRSMSFFDSKTCLSLRVLYLEERLFSRCCSSQALQDKPLLEKKFFRSNAKDSKVHHLCKEKKFKEAIHILCDQKRLRDAVRLLDQIERPSALVYSTLLQFCLKQRDVGAGKMVHGHMGKAGFLPGVVISNRLIDMYMKCDNLVDAQKTFDEMPHRDLCSWNTMISGYARAGRLSDARKLFDEMPERDNFSWTAMMSGYVRHDMPLEAIELFRMMQMLEIPMSSKFTFSSALAATAAILCLRTGKEIHGHILRLGLESDEVVWSALSDMYGKCGSVEEARHIFDRMVERDVVTWTAMIDRYFGDGRTEKGFMLFSELMCSKVRPNEFTFAGVLNACADHAAEQIGKQVHGYMMRTGFDPSSFAVSALVHMYSKCGNMESAERAFKGMPHPDLVSWTSLIVGFAQNGLPREALKYFDMLVESGIRPDHITFIGVLSACTHAGLVDKGLQYFHSITEQHGLTHTPDHYACIVDLLARSGRFKEAEEIISTMPMKPDRFLWASLLGGCRIHRNMELAKRASEELYQIEPDNPATYITMANMYATASMWDEVTKIREIMEDRGVVKKPGLSWTQIGRKQHVFLVGDTSHPKSNEIHVFLTEISKRMKEEGYVPDTNFVLHDVEEEQKEQNLAFHSEKLAVAYGILSTSPGTSVKVFKNLRTCVDCHNAIKFISKIMKRKIIVRDSNRFHCFENGICSCGEYW